MNKKEWEEIPWLHTEKQTVTIIKMENGGDKRSSEAKPPASYNRRKKEICDLDIFIVLTMM